MVQRPGGRGSSCRSTSRNAVQISEAFSLSRVLVKANAQPLSSYVHFPSRKYARLASARHARCANVGATLDGQLGRGPDLP